VERIMNLHEWCALLSQAYKVHGSVFSDEKKAVFLEKIEVPPLPSQEEIAKIKTLSPKEIDTSKCQELYMNLVHIGSISLLRNIPRKCLQTCEELSDILLREFFRRVCNSENFGDEGRIKKIFNMSLFENYKISSGPFYDMACTYWTFKLEMEDLFPEHYDIILSQILKSIDFEIAGLFFPTPGPYKIPFKERVKAQEETLVTYAPDFDRENFFKNNPVLDRLKANGKTKWPTITLIIIFVVIAWFIPQDIWWGKILFYVLMGMIVLCLCVIFPYLKRSILGDEKHL
jgi:hypothetical protein